MAVERFKLTKTSIEGLEAPAKGTGLRDVYDTLTPNLALRIAESGRKTFVLVARYAGRQSSPTRRALGIYPALTVEKARKKAAEWHDLLADGKDPQIEEDRARRGQVEKRQNTFVAVAEAWFKDKLPGERKGREVERDVRRDFIPIWGPRPISEITDSEVRSIIKAKGRNAPAQARNLLGIAKRLFSWAVDERCYGLTTSPAADLKPTKIIGEKQSDDRTLEDAELSALWRVSDRTPYPVGPVYKMLMLTGLRLNEVADARWSEFDIAKKEWTIPAARMKGKNSKARAHVVPLTDDMLTILDTLPRFKTGDCLFSTTFGEKPAWVSSKIKNRIDASMLDELRVLDPSRNALQPWKNHDIRRTVRSGLSRLKVAEAVSEAVLAHVRPGIKGVYDRHTYLDEKREALMLWAARLRSIVEPPAPDDKVVKLRA
jgi:integrase